LQSSFKYIIYYIREYTLFLVGGSCNRLALGYRGDNFSDLRRASLPQETALGNLLENVLTLTSKYILIVINHNTET